MLSKKINLKETFLKFKNNAMQHLVLYVISLVVNLYNINLRTHAQDAALVVLWRWGAVGKLCQRTIFQHSTHGATLRTVQWRD